MRLPSDAISGEKRRLRLWLIAAAIGVYFLFGIGLIAQKPGLQYDEALMISGAVHMQHSPQVFELENTPRAWICPFHRCIPLMSFFYIGSAKEYASLPFFAVFGPRAPVVRMVSLLFGAICIWGIFILVESWFGLMPAGIAAMALAINPAYLNMVTFDNGANGALLAALGLTCAGGAAYARRQSTRAAFWFGAAMGFGVWARANFVYLLISGLVAGAIVFRRRILIPVSHAAALVAGGIAGGFPFLLYQAVSGGETWKVQQYFNAPQSMAALLRYRWPLFAETLLSDGEHRKMWDGPPLPGWQFWLFPIVVVLASLLCLLGNRRDEPGRGSVARFLALAFTFTAGLLFFSHLQIAEHHIIVLIPFAVTIVVLACSLLQRRFRRTWIISSIVLCIYTSSAVYWQIQSMRGLRDSGGVGVWSNSSIELANYLDRNYPGRLVRIIDWGLQYNLYVLTNGRLRPREIDSPMSEDTDIDGRPWIDDIREGGVFLLNGPDNRQFPKPSAGFLKALSTANPVMKLHTVAQRSGLTYAEVIDITPNSIRGSEASDESALTRIEMNTREYDGRLTGFYGPEAAGFRWTKREFSARLSLPKSGGPAELMMRLYIPDSTIRQLGAVTLTASVNGRPLAPEKWSHAGPYVFRRELSDAGITGEAQIDFSLDRAIPPSASDSRELGIVVQEIAIEPQAAR
jgi:4-amino-4-deoxy-L-arabinose transferase-like glycosyltransferase